MPIMELVPVTEADVGAFRALARVLAIEHNKRAMKEQRLRKERVRREERGPRSEAEALEWMRPGEIHFIKSRAGIVGIVSIEKPPGNRISRIALTSDNLFLCGEVFRHILQQDTQPA